MVRGPAGALRDDALEAQLRQVQRRDESLDDPDRVVFADEVVGAFGKQRRLPPVLAFHEARHADLHPGDRRLPRHAFSHGLGGERTLFTPAWERCRA